MKEPTKEQHLDNAHDEETYERKDLPSGLVPREEYEKLENECAHLAANQCEYGAGDEGGNFYCSEIKRLRDQLAAKENILKLTFRDFSLILQTKDKELAELRQQSESQVKEIAELKKRLGIKDKKCPLCGSKDVIMFTSDDDLCRACSKIIPGT